MSDENTPETTGTDAVESPRFEAVMDELETLVNRLEAGELPLDEALSLYERGVKLSRTGNSILEDAERRVTVLQRPSE